MRKYSRVYQIRKKKSIFRNRFFWPFILILVILSGVFYLVSFSNFFQVKRTEISGNQRVPSENLENILKEEIEQEILFLSSKSIFLVNFNKIRERLLTEFPQIAKVDLKRNFPDKILVQIKERKPMAIFCQPQPEENCVLIDEEGIIIEQVSIKDLPKLAKIMGNIDSPRLGEKVIEKNYLASILEIQRELTLNQKIEIKKFIPLEGKLTVYTLENWQIFFDPWGDILDQILNLTILLKEKIPPENRRNLEYIDLRFGDRVYFKYR